MRMISMRTTLKKYLVRIIILLALLSVAVWVYRGNVLKSNNIQIGDLSTTTDVIEGDLLGTGSKQKIDITMDERTVKIEVFENGEVVASSFFDNGLVKPTSKYSVIKIDQNSSREYIRWDQFVGPHQVETLIITIGRGIVRPAIAADYDNEAWYAPFWSSRGQTYIGDIDNDGIAEVIEFVDEFPPDAPRLTDPEIEKITRREFSDDIEDDMWEIVSRENSGEGRGRKVIWNVYTILNNDPLLFEKADRENYERLTSKIIEEIQIMSQEVEGSTELISKYDLAQESIDFNIFVRDFWTQGSPYFDPF